MVETDLSSYTISEALLQYNDEGVLQPVIFYFKKNSLIKANYLIHDKEILTII